MQANKDLLLYMKDFQDIVVEMFSNLIKYYCKEPQSHKFLILIEWYKHKLSQNPSYEQK